MFKFVWNSKVNRVSQDILIKDYEEGGLKMINIELFLYAIKASWIKRIIDPCNKGQWKLKYQSLLNQARRRSFFQVQL